jgi:hypothetical protein
VGDEERLDAEPVARQEQRPAPRIPQGKGEHPLEFAHQVLAVLLVEVHDHLGVRMRAELVAACLQARAQRLEVVDLAVEHHRHRAVLVVDRL